ncbi:MAG: RAP domain-containing protein [Pseudomonadota bacterium]
MKRWQNNIPEYLISPLTTGFRKISIGVVKDSSHYVGGDFKTRNGSTLLKVALLQKLGYEVIEIPVNELGNHRFMEKVIAKIKGKSSIPPEARGSVSLKSAGGGENESYLTADEGWQSSDDCYLTAEEPLEEQTVKPKKRKRKRKKPVISTLPS